MLLAVTRRVRVRIGALGVHTFEPGWYVYTGSARRGLEARLARHLAPAHARRRHWHIDHLLAARGVRVVAVRRSRLPECRLRRTLGGDPAVPGFGASDCRAGCPSHLERLSDRLRAALPERDWLRVD
ncbi:MAG: GIY-YIG nuclease family protein [Acidobacteria bacterium]|nr:MAG: GIY-YIG nuclease family protein [Acidobacteriota bacterium]